jgi:hypothetical protein
VQLPVQEDGAATELTPGDHLRLGPVMKQLSRDTTTPSRSRLRSGRSRDREGAVALWVGAATVRERLHCGSEPRP